MILFCTSVYLPIMVVPVHPQSEEPSSFLIPEQAPEPLKALCFPVPLTIFHLLASFLLSGALQRDPGQWRLGLLHV